MTFQKKSSSFLRVLPMLVTALALLVLAACSGDDKQGEPSEGPASSPSEEASVTYEADVKAIVANNCLTCHGEASPIPLHEYNSLVTYVNGDDAGALMRTLDNGDNRSDGEPGTMYQYLGETDEEREENLEVFKEWIGHWTLKKANELTDEDLQKIKAVEK